MQPPPPRGEISTQNKKDDDVDGRRVDDDDDDDDQMIMMIDFKLLTTRKGLNFWLLWRGPNFVEKKAVLNVFESAEIETQIE